MLLANGYATLLVACSVLIVLEARETRWNENVRDYIVIGAGPAGYVLAARLSEDPSVTVTLLEAGPDGSADPNIYTPAFAGGLQNTEYAWNYTSQPDPNRGGIGPVLAQGHALGGGSSINFMEYCRGAASVFDEWAELSGNEGLEFNNLLEQFKLSSTLTVPSPIPYPEAANFSVYGDGPIQVSYNRELVAVEPLWGDTVAAAMSPPSPLIDMADGTGIGRINGGPQSINPKNGTRCSAQQSYGHIISSRSNVKVLTQALATKIHFSGTQAVSVNYITELDGANHTLTAAKEIILAAGNFGSPKLLMLSGVGPTADLEAVDIPVLLDVPELGSNIFDHSNSVVMVEIPSDIVSNWEIIVNATLLAELEVPFTANGTGLLATLMSSSFVTERPSDEFLDSINATFHKALPKDRPLLLYQYVTAPLVANPTDVNVISAFVSLVQPEASGSMKLASADYRDDPLIYSSYWGSSADLALEIYGYKKLRAAMASASMSSIVLGELYPGPNVTSDEELVGAIEGSAWSFHHAVGSCSLGKVVDGNFTIPGLKGLRVVDSSVIPSIPTCHVQASVYAVAELAAKIIIG